MLDVPDKMILMVMYVNLDVPPSHAVKSLVDLIMNDVTLLSK